MAPRPRSVNNTVLCASVAGCLAAVVSFHLLTGCCDHESAPLPPASHYYVTHRPLSAAEWGSLYPPPVPSDPLDYHAAQAYRPAPAVVVEPNACEPPPAPETPPAAPSSQPQLLLRAQPLTERQRQLMAPLFRRMDNAMRSLARRDVPLLGSRPEDLAAVSDKFRDLVRAQIGRIDQGFVSDTEQLHRAAQSLAKLPDVWPREEAAAEIQAVLNACNSCHARYNLATLSY